MAVRSMTLPANKKYVNGHKVDPAAQPKPSNAAELISKVPPVEIDGPATVCDGGRGPLGHPRVFINLEPHRPVECGYCGVRYVQSHSH
ncbi:NADH ubiquinone oxidoreductase subunit [Thecamonas trahens ATCC 50062]|uniref:NADH ubiquinone oxidoreductase subunit n=1 Tax=Thecamonas trahens ATCC 50062 TaxID=461836 RepID=A0A0L0DK36_THETB|nr:NADH ubiquinone oxidoreductase subunit [Thecamonas trahens ATCC 50062]KNC51723.1 NADH ubiquinone oxidoreductase subunit [Thecamonas trahens ATCC 50062]|eukprot:XP_013755852.1 NADH ubiquinone oxidoreductase subunit [Thecamonas trahens ATCC 50062]